jgi:hypothetical protein
MHVIAGSSDISFLVQLLLRNPYGSIGFEVVSEVCFTNDLDFLVESKLFFAVCNFVYHAQIHHHKVLWKPKAD